MDMFHGKWKELAVTSFCVGLIALHGALLIGDRSFVEETHFAKPWIFIGEVLVATAVVWAMFIARQRSKESFDQLRDDSHELVLSLLKSIKHDAEIPTELLERIVGLWRGGVGWDTRIFKDEEVSFELLRRLKWMIGPEDENAEWARCVRVTHSQEVDKLLSNPAFLAQAREPSG